METKFESKEAYLEWCSDIVTRIYIAGIAMKDESIREALEEIMSTKHTLNHQDLY